MNEINHLRERRAVLGINQQDAAHAADVSITYWGMMERGESKPSLEVARRVAAALQCGVDDLWPNEAEEGRAAV
jgi:DNA-binding XRE family transcriptional regulator